MNPNDRFDVRELSLLDVDEVASLHAQCFEGYFSTQLGRPCLRRYYAEFCRHAFDYGVVARDHDTGNLAAFVVGTADAQAHFRHFYRRNMHVLAPLVLARFLTSRIVRKQIWDRMAHIKTALRSLIPGVGRNVSGPINDKGPKNRCPLRLLSIAAGPAYRGSGLAALVSDRFEDLLRTDGHKRVGLSVWASNNRAIAFYKKAGWQVVHASDAGWYFEKDL